ncbi:MAG TPA: glycoside hydrolase family 27 protein [Pyrinomonadaceae bacterium]|nr:glycoside hydrolase family 27 protein [Pyrinomonadaceae bacterium]
MNKKSQSQRFRNALYFLAAIMFVGHSLTATANAQIHARNVAATPPMGWNSWDSYGRTLNEDTIRANALWMAQNLKQYGWEYVVVDEGWYLANLNANDVSNVRFEMDSYGRYIPVPARFPSTGSTKSFRPLANYLHSLGLKFGLHIIRGIPREAVKKNLPIAGSSYTAKDAADTSDVCPWNAYNYGLNSAHPAAQAYYDSLAKQYADWKVDFIKIDCISDHPYKGDEIRMFSQAIVKSGRAMVLSLSPGPTARDKQNEVSNYSHMWRISDDVWDVWYSSTNFPQGVKNQFARAALWSGVARPGRWPDADMLPIGSLRPAAGWGEPRETRLSHDEQRTLLTLWSIFRSPLIMGGNLTRVDEWTKSLLTNAEVIAVDQHSIANRPVVTTDDVVIWTARPERGRFFYVAVFNLSDAEQAIHYQWSALDLPSRQYELRDLWVHRDLPGSASELEVKLRPHAAVLYRALPVKKRRG